MADQEVIKHVKHAVEVARSKRPWMHKLQEILLEIVIIVFAVSLSIWLHNWSEGRKDRDEEREFLVGLKQDLQADSTEMASDRAAYQHLLKGVGYYQRVGGGELVNSDSLKSYQFILFSSAQIDPRVSRFEALRGSGRLGIVRDKELLVHITDLYTKDFPQIRRVNDYINGLRADKLLPWFAAHAVLDTSGRKVTNMEAILRLPETRFLIGTLQSGFENIAAYDRGIEKIQLIIREVDTTLE